MPEIGSVVAGGSTKREAIEAVTNIAEQVKGYDVKFNAQALEDAAARHGYKLEGGMKDKLTAAALVLVILSAAKYLNLVTLVIATLQQFWAVDARCRKISERAAVTDARCPS